MTRQSDGNIQVQHTTRVVTSFCDHDEFFISAPCRELVSVRTALRLRSSLTGARNVARARELALVSWCPLGTAPRRPPTILILSASGIFRLASTSTLVTCDPASSPCQRAWPFSSRPGLHPAPRVVPSRPVVQLLIQAPIPSASDALPVDLAVKPRELGDVRVDELVENSNRSSLIRLTAS